MAKGRTLILNPKEGRRQINKLAAGGPQKAGADGKKLVANRRTVLKLKRKLRQAIQKKQDI